MNPPPLSSVYVTNLSGLCFGNWQHGESINLFLIIQQMSNDTSIQGNSPIEVPQQSGVSKLKQMFEAKQQQAAKPATSYQKPVIQQPKQTPGPTQAAQVPPKSQTQPEPQQNQMQKSDEKQSPNDALPQHASVKGLASNFEKKLSSTQMQNSVVGKAIGQLKQQSLEPFNKATSIEIQTANKTQEPPKNQQPPPKLERQDLKVSIQSSELINSEPKVDKKPNAQPLVQSLNSKPAQQQEGSAAKSQSETLISSNEQKQPANLKKAPEPEQPRKVSNVQATTANLMAGGLRLPGFGPPPPKKQPNEEAQNHDLINDIVNRPAPKQKIKRNPQAHELFEDEPEGEGTKQQGAIFDLGKNHEETE